MEISRLLIAVLLPWLLGSVWVRLVIPANSPARHSLILGYGLMLGLLLMPLLMRLIDALGLAISFGNTAVSALLLVVAGIIGNIICGEARVEHPVPTPSPAALNSLQRALVCVLWGIIGLRILSLGAELLWRPLYPWDTALHWATKSRVWFDSQSISPFVSNLEWLQVGGSGVHTDFHPDYPITIPLLQVWMNSAIGRWDESLMNIPWLLCYVALGLMFYGQARLADVGTFKATVFTYFLLSLPLLNTHVALAGYADLFLGVCYAAAVTAFYNWYNNGDRWQGLLALLFAIACPLIKNEGLYWSLSLIPAMVAVYLPPRRAALLLSLALVSSIALLLVFPRDLVIAGHSMAQLNIYYWPEALPAIAKSLFWHGSWHLLAWLALCIVPLAMILKKDTLAKLRGIAVALACALGLYLFLFLFTRYAFGTVNFAAVGRITLHLAPAGMFLLMLLYHEVSTARQKNAVQFGLEQA
jgi:hypothetical protein